MPAEGGGAVGDEGLLQRAGIGLAVVKAAQQRWQAHMRRAALLGSEDEYAAALALVPSLPSPGAGLARTLRGLADLCAAQGRLDEAAAFMQRIADGGGRLSARFWCDYAGLLFKLGLARVGAGQVALANAAFERAGTLLRGPADLPEVWRAAFEGYADTALWFERAGEPVPAGLYAERALDLALRLQDFDAAAGALRRLAQAAQAKGGSLRALHWLERLQDLRRHGWAGALPVAVQAALGLARAELGVGREAAARAVFNAAEAWLHEAGPESPALADLHLGWGLSLGPGAGRPHLERALSLRRRLLGPQHPRTREAEQALAGLASGTASQPKAQASEGAQPWDGGAQFQAPLGQAAAEIKRLQRRLVRLCHPDAAPGQAWRHDLMVRVNHAAAVGDLFGLRALFREALGRLAQAGPAGGSKEGI